MEDNAILNIISVISLQYVCLFILTTTLHNNISNHSYEYSLSFSPDFSVFSSIILLNTV